MKSTKDAPAARTPLLRMMCTVIVAALVAVSCSSNDQASDDPVSPDETASEAPPTPTADTPTFADETPTATPSTEPEPTDDITDADRIDAALSQLETDGLDGYIAWDLLDSRVDDTGLVRLELCAWSGTTVDDDVIESRWQTMTKSAELTAASRGMNLTAGDCLNTTLIDSALAFTRDYDQWIGAASRDPAGSIDALRSNRFMTEAMTAATLEKVEQWAVDGISVRPAVENGTLPDGVIRPMLIADLGDRLGLVACEPMNLDYGFYRDDVLVDDKKPDQPAGTHTISLYLLQATERSDEPWLVAGTKGLVWTDCFAVADFERAVGDWVGEGTWAEF